LTAVIFLPSAGLALGKDFAECRFLALGKEIFADKVFAERPLPSAALGKAFAECLPGFAECPQHSAKRASAVGSRMCHLVSDFRAQTAAVLHNTI